MAIDKIQSESINLADNFAFSGTVTGAGEEAGLKLLNHTSISSATASVVYNNSLITSSHNIYKIVWANVVPATSNVALLLKTSTDNGSNFLGFITGHRYNGISLSNNANRNNQDNGAISMATDVSNSATYGACSGEITIGNVNNSAGYKHAWGKNIYLSLIHI